jgi:hypothetical protein
VAQRHVLAMQAIKMKFKFLIVEECALTTVQLAAPPLLVKQEKSIYKLKLPFLNALMQEIQVFGLELSYSNWVTLLLMYTLQSQLSKDLIRGYLQIFYRFFPSI